MKTRVLAVMVCVLAVVNVASADLVAQWDFSGNANDISGNGNHGTVYGATLTTDRFGYLNSAYSFDGASSYIDVPNADSLNPTSAITITAWFKADSFTSGWPNIVSKRNNDGTHGYTMEIQQASESNPCAGFAVELEGKGLRGIPVSVGAPTLTPGTWYFLAGVYDGAAFKTYLGTNELPPLVVTSENGEGNIVPSSNNLWIGNAPIYGNRAFDGTIDDVRIYNSALTSEQVIEVYPEPATLLLFGMGGLALLRNRRAE